MSIRAATGQVTPDENRYGWLRLARHAFIGLAAGRLPQPCRNVYNLKEGYNAGGSKPTASNRQFRYSATGAAVILQRIVIQPALV
ncbi:hypothetical protein EDC30_101259 [Paucimonas lemoignei]|uniref:Uncharacterized protein n=1 Tax=Paucimonas lemoignei TaxID=29443 RepID=A0A4R3I2Q6_PAULE|nr:hypothetical protein EDC30_101259 [Paucimonas lemoignei]